MKKYIFIVFGFLAIVILIFVFKPTKEYRTIDDIEILFQKHNISYGTKDVNQQYMLDTANEQRIFEIDGNEVFVYLIDKIHFEQTFIDISNDLFKDSILAPS